MAGEDDPSAAARQATERSPEAPAVPPVSPPARARVRDRDVFLIFAAIVAGVLVLNLVSAAIRPLDRILAIAPVVVIAMVAVTTIVLVRSIRRGSGRG